MAVLLTGGGVVPFLGFVFTLDGVEYQAETGMTWQDWVGSKYNTPTSGTITIDSDGYVTFVEAGGTSAGVRKSGSSTVEKSSDLIIEGCAYSAPFI